METKVWKKRYWKSYISEETYQLYCQGRIRGPSVPSIDIQKTSNFCLQNAYDKCFWQVTVTNSKWSLILKFSFWHMFNIASQLKRISEEIFKSSSNTAFQAKTIVVPNSVNAIVFTVKLNQLIRFICLHPILPILK